MKCSFMFTIDEVEIYSTEIDIPEEISFSNVLKQVKKSIIGEGYNFNDIKGLSVLVKD